MTQQRWQKRKWLWQVDWLTTHSSIRSKKLSAMHERDPVELTDTP